VFGKFIGVWLVSRSTNYHLYLLEKWKHVDSNWYTIVLRILLKFAPAAGIACIFGVVLQSLTVNVYLKYLLVHFSTLRLGLLPIWIPSHYPASCSIIDLQPLPDTQPT